MCWNFDLTNGTGHLADVFRTVNTRFLVISFTSDWLYPSYQAQEIVRVLRRMNADAMPNAPIATSAPNALTHTSTPNDAQRPQACSNWSNPNTVSAQTNRKVKATRDSLNVGDAGGSLTSCGGAM